MITKPLVLIVQHKILGIAIVSCLGAGGAAVAITTASSAPTPLLVPASAASAVPVQPAGSSAGGSHAGSAGGAAGAASAAAKGGETTATSPAPAPAAARTAAAPPPTKAKAAGATSPARTNTGGSTSSGAPSTAALPAPAAATVSCPSNQRLTNAEIKWLLGEVAKTASSNPSVASGAATITAQLQPLLDQNECAAQAQPVVTALCSGSATRKTINAMAGQMPFLVKLVVGNPCSDNLASLLPTLSSYTSLL